MDSTIYINNSGNYGETVIFSASDREALFAGLNDCFGNDFDPDEFDSLTHKIDLDWAMNHTQDQAGDDWQETIITWNNNHAAFMPGAVTIFEAFYAIWQQLSAVVTPGEIAREFDIADATVRQAIERAFIPARKSGGTWLIARVDAEARWGNRR